METFLFLFEMLGTIAFAASGAVLGVRKGLDVFGVCILGLTTACGGGMVRDVLLGNTPPAAFQNPTASAVAVVTSLIMFLSGVRHLLMGNQRRYDLFMLLMDSAGLGIFTVMGVRVAWNCVEAPSLYLLVFVGVLTGVGGGLLQGRQRADNGAERDDDDDGDDEQVIRPQTQGKAFILLHASAPPYNRCPERL